MRGGRFKVHSAAEDKERLRKRIMLRRGRLRPAELREAAVALRDVLLATPEVGRAAVVAAYVSVGTEPGTGPLLEALSRRGIRVLLPVVERDLDLNWAAYTGPSALAPARFGLLEPTGPRLGKEVIATADAVLLPGLAVDRTGMRLGRGGGSYDMALPRVAREAFSCVLLHEGELFDEPVPSDRHDWRVRSAALPSGLIRFDPV
ncbi:MAG TPA: 5-formyltetrahydrofolate cyclo-ligase [Actinopolymorphaceae bacterium]|jgi:5-formyltetrahydrofolate cyclo-ligase